MAVVFNSIAISLATTAAVVTIIKYVRDQLNKPKSVPRIRTTESQIEGLVARVLSRTSHNEGSIILAKYKSEVSGIDVRISTNEATTMLEQSDIFDAILPIQRKLKGRLFIKITFSIDSQNGTSTSDSNEP